MENSPSPRKSEARRSKTMSRQMQIYDDFAENLPLCLIPPFKSRLSLLQIPPQESPSPVKRTKHCLTPNKIVRSPTILGRSLGALEDLRVEPMNKKKPRRNSRHSRRRSDQGEFEDRKRDLDMVEEHNRARRSRHLRSGSRREKVILDVPALPSTAAEIPEAKEGSLYCYIEEQVVDLIMWKDVSKSSLWFGLGCLCFLSTCYTREINISSVSVVSNLGLLLLAVSFLFNSFSGIREKKNDLRRRYELNEDDVKRVVRVVLPLANEAFAKIRELFSGEPLMTLRMAPLLLLAAEFGPLLSIWRLAAAGFLVSFTVPKLYSSYSDQIQRQVKCTGKWFLEAWSACSHKKIVVASVATVFWNLSTVKTRAFAAFLCLVTLRHYQQVRRIEEEQHGLLVVSEA
ncbi:reticulon-like protein B18 isoform X1 [Amborella trichopoda]|nr:reticulon-like protein B18 isoform X1 [Amborella trichopoda]|eukprot:XP_006852583.2 reticulon-like protein B18 isoform X1 [Amborella trichopoda]